MAHRSIASVQEVYFEENGREFGNGVLVTHFRDGSAQVRLPIMHEVEPGQWNNVQLRVKSGQSVSTAYEKFLDGVEYEPPAAYRIIGNDAGRTVIAKLSAEHYARLRAALRASESLIAAPVEEHAAPKNRELLDALVGTGGAS